jgi:hypothetical protein
MKTLDQLRLARDDHRTIERNCEAHVLYHKAKADLLDAEIDRRELEMALDIDLELAA